MIEGRAECALLKAMGLENELTELREAEYTGDTGDGTVCLISSLGEYLRATSGGPEI